jgi:hypothetical protein
MALPKASCSRHRPHSAQPVPRGNSRQRPRHRWAGKGPFAESQSKYSRHMRAESPIWLSAKEIFQNKKKTQGPPRSPPAGPPPRRLTVGGATTAARHPHHRPQAPTPAPPPPPLTTCHPPPPPPPPATTTIRHQQHHHWPTPPPARRNRDREIIEGENEREGELGERISAAASSSSSPADLSPKHCGHADPPPSVPPLPQPRLDPRHRSGGRALPPGPHR